MYEKADQGQMRVGQYETQKKQTFRAEVELHLVALRRQVARMVPAGAVEDVVQEALMAAWRHAESLDDVQKSGAWLAAIGRRKAIDWLRRESRSVLHEPLEVIEPTACLLQSPEGALSQKQSLCLVHDAVASLPPRQQAVMGLRALEEKDVHDTAAILSIAEKTVYATEASARDRLKQSPLMKKAWTMLSAMGSIFWMLCSRSKQIFAQSAGWFKTSIQASGWAKTSAALWTGSVGAASLAGIVALGPRPDATEGLSRKLSMNPKPSAFSSPTLIRSKANETPFAWQPVSLRSTKKSFAVRTKKMEKQGEARRKRSLGGIQAMKTKNVLAMALLAAGLFTSEVAQAKKKPVVNPATTANGDILRYRKVTKLDFEGSTMTGNVEKPMMSLFWGKRRRKMKSLITFRKNFRERLASTAASL